MSTPPNIAALIAQSGPVETIPSSIDQQLIGSPTQQAAAAPPTTIRNISQTAQEREIIKLAPDLVVYFEGLPYMVNYFINDPTTKNNYTIVPHNDYVTTFNAGYDTDLLVPSASIQLQVPNNQKHLFQMPGGNNLIQTMMQVQVFAKGYYFGNDGSTLLRRVFKGIVSHISYNDDGKMFQIQVQCYGTLHLMELMQVDLAPAVISNSLKEIVPFKTQLALNNPYMMLLDMFVRAISTEGFYVNSIEGGKISDPTDAFHQSVVDGYMAKWQQILNGLRLDVHIYGLTYKDNPSTTGNTQASPVANQMDLNTLGAQLDRYNALTEAQQVAQFAVVPPSDGSSANAYPAIRQYLPDMEISTIQLLNGKIINRLDEIRQISRMILYEAYQDVDGKIIFKPPLYNLDVTNVGTETDTIASASAGSAGSSPQPSGSGTTPNNPATNPRQNPITELTTANNPFIINLSEIITEGETEDQAAIKTTRMTVQGNWEPSFQFNGNPILLETVEFIDIPKLQKFGLREEPTRPVGWFKDGDKLGLFAYAVAETVRNNRGYRTYTVTIPLRPELKLGFPCFIPHRDMYGYIKSIQIQYNQGGQATMTVMMDALRRRPMLPSVYTDPNGATHQIFTSQPNLVWQWTTNPAPVPTTGQAPVTTGASTQPQGQQTATGSDASTNQTRPLKGPQTSVRTPITAPTVSSPANIIGAPASTPTTPDQQPSPQEQILTALNRGTLGTSWGTEPDTKGACFRIQNDTHKPWVAPAKTGESGSYPAETNPDGGVFWSKSNKAFSRHVDAGYYHDIRRTMPFTDDKGYEVISPFPWGRWVSLRQAFKEFTEDGYIVPKNIAQALTADLIPPSSVQALIAAGLATPNVAGDTVTQLQQVMNAQVTSLEDSTVIVLSYSGTTPSDSQLDTTAQPDVNSAIKQLQGTLTTQQQALDVLVSGDISPTKATKEALAGTQTPPATANLGLTSKASSKPKDLYPVTSSGQQGTS